MKKFDDRLEHPKLTPMLQQWKDIKSQYPDHIIFFRAGDFYETFNEDAQIASETLNITLTSRKTGEINWPLAGVPFHAVEGYISKMVESGYKVAMVEQLEDAKFTKKLVKRGVTQIVTKGTIMLPESLGKLNNYLTAINREEKGLGLSALDLSTGEFFVIDFQEDSLEKLSVELTRLNPSELLVEKNLFSKLGLNINQNRTSITYRSDYYFDIAQGKDDLCRHFKIASLDGFGIDGTKPSIGSAGALLRYVKETQMTENLPNITKITPLIDSEYLILDSSTIRSLELLENIQDRTEYGTLKQILDKTKTAPGSRLLTSWLLRPSARRDIINARLDAVDELFKDIIVREDIRFNLSQMNDIERIIGRICLGKSRPRDLVALKNSLEIIPKIKESLSKLQSSLLKNIYTNLNPVQDVVNIVSKAIEDEVPHSIKDGNVIRKGFNKELDELRDIKSSGKSFLTSLEAREKEKTKIKSLKVRFNKVFGYYIEVPRASANDVPETYERKQTLVNAERYITPELKEYEEKILNAEERILLLEEEIFCQINLDIAQFARLVQQNAHYCAFLDVLTTLATNAVSNNYVKPTLVEESVIEIKEGRHPVVEQLLPKNAFIANDCILNDDERLLVITGPNMAGKSTLLRQVALITLMAHMGSFVPANLAKIGLVDRIFTRIGAHDVLIEQRSTFMVEMQECANILNNATDSSLVILDEVGRGTSTFDGLSIAWAISEYLHDSVGRKGPFTLFATHYHELIELEELLPRVKNYHVAVKDINGDIHFLYKIKKGGIDESYGVHVASLAGLPKKVIERAKDLLCVFHGKTAEEECLAEDDKAPLAKSKTSKLKQMTLVGEIALQAASISKSTKEPQSKKPMPEDQKDSFISSVSSIDVNRLTPIEAINILEQLVNKGKKIVKRK